MDAVIKRLSREELDCHLAALKQIDSGTIGEIWDDTHFRTELPGKWMFSATAQVRGAPVGFVIASRKASSIHIHRIAVADSSRGLGVGTALLHHVASCALDSGVESVTLRVARENRSAVALYERTGFCVDANEDGLLEMRAPVEELQTKTASSVKT